MCIRDRDKVTLIFEKGGEYVLAKEKDKAAGETEKEDTEDKNCLLYTSITH